MKAKSLLIFAILALMLVESGEAATDQTNCVEKYFPNEITFDGFGTYDKPFGKFNDIFDHSWRGGEYGGGIGLNYFITRYIGVGADTFWEDSGEFWKNVSGSVILRMPLFHTGLAPYVFGGGGGRFEPVSAWTAHAGLGLEFRFTRHIGIFGDCRYIWADRGTGAVLPRAGLRIAF